MSLDLIPEEGFVLSRIDGSTPAHQLPFLTGLGQQRVETILHRLVALGALEGPKHGEGPDDGAGAPAGHGLTGGEGEWRRIYQRDFRHLAEDRRVEHARSCQGHQLRALCFDPSPRVVAGLLENPALGVEHARLIARHHRSGQGLTTLSQHVGFLRDRQVTGELFRNPLTSEILFQRLLLGKSLMELYGFSSGRNATERARNASREALRKTFYRASAAEKVQLIWKTEGRCLTLLAGSPIDGRTAALLCRRPVSSQLLARNLARWPATPPQVLKHLMRQAIVKCNPDLRNQILRHPNRPTGVDASRV